MTANQLRQVLRTYTTHWLCWVTVLLWLVLHVQLPSASEKALDYIVWMSLMANLTLGMGIGLMLKLQFANPRARLLPGFRVAHLVAAGAIVGAAIAIEAVLVLAGGGAVAQLPLLSLTLLAIVASAWIREQRCQNVLVGSVEECGAVMEYICSKKLGIAEDGRIKPFEFSRSPSVAPGEGSVFLLLTRADGPKRYCELRGVSVNDEAREGNPDLCIIDADGMSGDEICYQS